MKPHITSPIQVLFIAIYKHLLLCYIFIDIYKGTKNDENGSRATDIEVNAYITITPKHLQHRYPLSSCHSETVISLPAEQQNFTALKKKNGLHTPTS
jgi:hypothetical protein